MPFLIEGPIWGLGGAGLAVLSLFICDQTIAPELSLSLSDAIGGLDIHLFSPMVSCWMLCVGLFLGIFASAISVGRFLDFE